jgi:hypothetical protein
MDLAVVDCTGARSFAHRVDIEEVRVMKRSTLTFIAAACVVAASTVSAGPGADPSQAFEVSGIVLAVTGGSGSGMPMLVVDDASLGQVDVALGPVWFLQNSGFSAAEGDSVHLLAYECSTCAAAAVAAWVDNLTNGTSVDLRDDGGRPLWTKRQSQRGGSARPGRGGGSGGGGGAGTGGGSGAGGGSGEPGGSGTGTGSGPANGSGLDMSQVETVTGYVVSFTGHSGSGEPILALDVDGETVEITVSPYQPVAAAGLVIEPGVVLTVDFAPTLCDGEPHLVAISIVDVATGVTVQLRDPETGFPMTNGGGHHRPTWP